MERYAAVLLYAIPFFMILIIIERIFAWKMNAKVIRPMDTLASLSSGTTNVVKDVLGLTFVIVSYGWFQENFALITIKDQWYIYLIAFFGIDFAGYWNHRLSHQVNYFWNVHLAHHSSEEFNLACALRQSISGFFGTVVFFLIPTAIIGVPPEVITVVSPLHLFAQYWYHTRLIGKMGFLEKIIVTPSHHRVHHAINDEYLDKNLSQIFIFWDKLFGTFQEELEDVPPVYGVKRPTRTWNPILINFSHLSVLISDAWRTQSFVDKLKIWFMPTGWRPADVEKKYPLKAIEDVYKYKKYRPELTFETKAWCWIQATVTFGIMLYMFVNFKDIGFPNVFYMGAFIYLSVYNYSSLMDKSKYTWLTSLLHSGVGLSIILITNDWFELTHYSIALVYALATFYLLSFFITLYFYKREIQSDNHLKAQSH